MSIFRKKTRMLYILASIKPSDFATSFDIKFIFGIFKDEQKAWDFSRTINGVREELRILPISSDLA